MLPRKYFMKTAEEIVGEECNTTVHIENNGTDTLLSVSFYL